MTFTVQLSAAQYQTLAVLGGKIVTLLETLDRNDQELLDDVSTVKADLAYVRVLLAHALRPATPEILGIEELSQFLEGSTMKFQFTFTLVPAVDPSDVKTRTLTAVIGGVSYAAPQDPTVTASTPFVGTLGDTVVANLQDVDAAGNNSLPSLPFNWTVDDEIPPAQPGAVGGVTELAEVGDDVPNGPVT